VVVDLGTPVPIQRFAAAVQSGDVLKIKQAYPALTETERKGWENAFKQGKPERVTVTRVHGVSPLDATGVSVVEFTLRVSFTTRTSGEAVAARPTRYQARLKREGTVLVLQSLTPVASH
jgi:hypothetical protein